MIHDKRPSLCYKLGKLNDNEIIECIELSGFTMIDNNNNINNNIKIDLNTILHNGGTFLSLGQRQLLCFARALSCIRQGCRYIIIDEATASLDVKAKNHIISVLKNEINQWDCALLMITHDMSCTINIDNNDNDNNNNNDNDNDTKSKALCHTVIEMHAGHVRHLKTPAR
jgi:ABC-type transport system involved in cytochrome bd biosynthesis fused ATPase/permease subunit